MSRFILDRAPQNSPEWYARRAGRVTGSNAGSVTAQGKTKGAESTMRRNLRAQIVTERLTGKSLEEGSYESPDMKNGKGREPFGRMGYEAVMGEFVDEVGFAYLSDLAAGCSVDGSVNNFEGILEIKCPKPATHIDYLTANRLPPEYVEQARHNLFVTGARYLDFVSFNPDMPENAQILIVRVEPSEMDLPGYEKALRAFLGECDKLEAELRAYKRPISFAVAA